MRCPKDLATLEKSDFANVEALRCPTCKGIFVERKSLEILCPPGTNLEHFTELIGSKFQGEAKSACPNDGKLMLEVAHKEHLVDICPSCCGIWFDHKELEAIIAQGGLPGVSAAGNQFGLVIQGLLGSLASP